MIVLSFFAVSLISAVVYSIRAKGVSRLSDAWKPLLLFAGIFVALNLLYVLFVFIAGLFVNRSKPLKKQSGVCRNLCWLSGGLVCTYAGVHAKITGKEKLPENDRFLYVCNHLSGFDPLVVFNKLRKYNIAFISKPSNMKTKLVGNAGYGAGNLVLDRENNREALKTIETAARYIREGICSIAIYPEGTRSKTGEMGPFHAGSFKIAKKADAPVVVACSTGTNHVTENMFRRPTNVRLDILEVIPVEKVREMTTTELAEYSRSLIAAHQRKLAEGTA